MRILFLNYEYPPLGAGAANATECILREYVKIPGLEVDLVTSSIDEKYHLEEIGENIRIHKLPIGKNGNNLHFQSAKDLLIYLWRAYWFSRKLCRENKFDLSHSFFTVPSGLISLALKVSFKLPYIISLRGSDVPGYSDRFPLIYAFLGKLFGYIWKKSSATISNSQELKDLALKTNPKQEIGVIYNGINTNYFKPDLQKKSQEEFIIMPGASRITARKGLRYLIEAVSKLSKTYPKLKLKLIGDGNEKESLEELVRSLKIEEKVEFVGRVPHEKVLRYYQEASVFVLPSLNEGMSNAMLEALAVGLPILATDTGGSKKVISEGQNGYIIKMKDSDDIVEKLEKILSDQELLRKMGENSRAQAEKMSWENVAKEYFELYKKIIKI